MTEIVLPIVIVAAIGLISGLGLAIASIVMAVPKNEKAEEIEEILPGANCGACGYSGCSGYALALSEGKAKPGLCAPGGDSTSIEISKLLGIKAESIEKKVAMVHCLGSYDNTSSSMVYQGINSCFAASMLHGGVGNCSYGCMGFGDCMEACPFDAITVKKGLSVVDNGKCKGCSACIDACPKHLISLAVYKSHAVVKCSNCSNGAATVKVCKVGCIGCKMCVRSCEYEAIKVENFVAKVDESRCVGCGKCVGVCKRGCIEMI